MGSDPGVTFDTYPWATICDHATMAQFLKYTFGDYPDISTAITKFTVFNSP